jgi:hypothetical protein
MHNNWDADLQNSYYDGWKPQWFRVRSWRGILMVVLSMFFWMHPEGGTTAVSLKTSTSSF